MTPRGRVGRAGSLVLAGAVVVLGGCATAARSAGPDAEAAVDAVLTDFHAAASAADYERYFGHFAEDAVFLGTDAGERWTADEFRRYAGARFDQGQGWTYVATSRNVTVAPDGRTAWFDEMLDNANYGVTRGTGVLVLEDGRWRIAQYHLTIPVPNELARTVVEMIRRR